RVGVGRLAPGLASATGEPWPGLVERLPGPLTPVSLVLDEAVANRSDGRALVGRAAHIGLGDDRVLVLTQDVLHLLCRLDEALPRASRRRLDQLRGVARPLDLDPDP